MRARAGRRGGAPPASVESSLSSATADALKGTRCSRRDFIRVAGIVHIALAAPSRKVERLLRALMLKAFGPVQVS